MARHLPAGLVRSDKGVDAMARRIVIVGVGALGSHVVQMIRNIDAVITAIDMDVIEQKNVMAQFHGKTNVGKLKVQSLKQTMDFLFGVKLEINPNKLTEINVDVMLGKADLVVDCLDNGESRRVVQTYVRSKKIPCIHGALDADGMTGYARWDDEFTVDDEAGGQATCEGGEHLPFISATAAYLAQAIKVFWKTGKQQSFQVLPSGVKGL